MQQSGVQEVTSQCLPARHSSLSTFFERSGAILLFRLANRRVWCSFFSPRCTSQIAPERSPAGRKASFGGRGCSQWSTCELNIYPGLLEVWTPFQIHWSRAKLLLAAAVVAVKLLETADALWLKPIYSSNVGHAGHRFRSNNSSVWHVLENDFIRTPYSTCRCLFECTAPSASSPTPSLLQSAEETHKTFIVGARTKIISHTNPLYSRTFVGP